MGVLEAWHYPTKIVVGLADHTYVACGTGSKAWGCWGGKTGGTRLRWGPGSTAQADAIAEPDERAGVTCYLVNGVCHQAANRILYPARLTVRGARGYRVSEAVYGPYGRPRGPLGFCKAAFERHQHVTGDLPACIQAPAAGLPSSSEGGEEPEADARNQRYLEYVISRYAELPEPSDEGGFSLDNLRKFELDLFVALVGFRLGSDFSSSNAAGRLVARRSSFAEERLAHEERFIAGETSTEEFVSGYNELIQSFQWQAAEVIDSKPFQALFDLEPGDTVVLGDPEIARSAWGEGIGG